MVFNEAFFYFDFIFFIQVMLLIDIELSYINTNHEDFIGFAKYVTPHSHFYSLTLQAYKLSLI